MRFTATRIIGIAVLALSIFFYLTNPSAGVYLLFAMSLIFLLAPEKYGEQQWKNLLSSFDFKNISLITLFDLVFWFVLILSAFLVYEKATLIFEATLAKANPNVAQTLDPAQMDSTSSLIVKFFLYSGLISIGFIVINLLSYTLSRSLLWTSLLKKKFNAKVYLKFLSFNVLWWSLWTVILIFLAIKRAPEVIAVFTLVFICLYTHTSTVAHYHLAKTNKIKETFAKSFSIAYGKLHLFILPYSFILLIYFILSKAILYIPLGSFASTANLILLLLIMNMGRAYLKNVMDEI